MGVGRRGARPWARVFTDPAKVHDIEHHGQYFTVPGPFLCEPSAQRTPLLFQAGASARGVRFAAAHAEAVFVSGPTPMWCVHRYERCEQKQRGWAVTLGPSRCSRW